MNKSSIPCIGIIGGMGPLAGVKLQRLIIQATPARSDQEHLRVLCFTDPSIPDRTTSLKNDGGRAYIRAVCEAAQLLERAGATILVIACNTAHARFADVQRAVSIPIFHLIEETISSIRDPLGSKIGILATDGALESRIFEEHLIARGYVQVRPSIKNQKLIMKTIYDLKSRVIQPTEAARELAPLIRDWNEKGIRSVILGCTELSLCFEILQHQTTSCIIDPLRVAAKTLVAIST